MKPLIIANWKMNPETYDEAEKLVSAIKSVDRLGVEVVICPPFCWLTDFSHKEKDLMFGAQDVFWENKGAFTGEISPTMLKNSGVEYVIVGHSERRKYFGETNELVNKKLKAVLDAGMKPVLCVGENEGEDREEILKEQLAGILETPNLVIAYEPVWAIGTGRNCQPDDVIKAVESIKNLVGNVRVLYGGSVNAQNAEGYLKEAGVDGLLVGGASLKADEFTKIVALANK